MIKDFFFYECHLERGMASEGDPGLFAATEVVRAACNANFQRNGFYMRSYPSSPHCYYKYAKLPKDGMYMLWAVKKTDLTTLDILVDTRMYPNLVMIESNTDWQAETEEVKDTVEQVISGDSNPYNWNVNLQEHRTNKTQHLDEFHSALSYMREPNYIYGDYNSNITLNNSNSMEQNSEDFKLKVIQELTKGNVNIGQFIMEVKGNNNYYENSGHEEMEKHEVPDKVGKDCIMEYLWRLKPVVREQYLSVYGEIWNGILELNEVKVLIYNKGKQQDTTFNRNLLGQLIHQVGNRLYLPTANTVKMAEYLEPEKGQEHPIRQKLGESPEKNIKIAVEAYLKEHI